MRERFGANYAGIFLRRPKQKHSLIVYDALGLRPDHHARYFAQFAGKDPLDSQRRPTGKVLTLAMILAEEAGRAFYESFLLPSGMVDYMLCCVDEPSGFRAGIVVTRPAGVSGFTPVEQAWLERVGRHFAPGLRIYARLKRAELDQSVHDRLSASFAIGVVLLNADGRVVEIDCEARRRLEHRSDIFIERDRLRLSDRQANSRLARNIEDLLCKPSGQEYCVAMEGNENRDLELLLCTIDPGAGYASPDAPRLAIYTRSGDTIRFDQMPQILDLYNLTRREAELAGLLTHGMTLAEAARELGVTEMTARTYSKRIFLKTGVRRQSELVRRLLDSVARLSNVVRAA